MIKVTSTESDEVIILSMSPQEIGHKRLVDGETYEVTDNNTVTLVTLKKVA